jgi:hypothetical protein
MAIMKRLLIALSVAWVLFAAYDQWLASDAIISTRTTQFDRQMESCYGTFKQRYDCKSAIMVAEGQNLFALWATKAAIIGLPPLLIAIIYSFVVNQMRARHQRELEAKRAKAVAERAAREAEEEAFDREFAARRQKLDPDYDIQFDNKRRR